MAISAKIRLYRASFARTIPPLLSSHHSLFLCRHVFSPILRFPSADVRLLRALLQESGETINTSLQNGEGTEQAALLGELCVSEREGGQSGDRRGVGREREEGRSRENGTFPGDSSEKRRAQAWLQADMPGYEREKMMRRRVAPAFYPLPLVGDPVDRDSRPRLHDFGRAGTTSGLYPLAITLLHNFRENSLCSVFQCFPLPGISSLLFFPSVLSSILVQSVFSFIESFREF